MKQKLEKWETWLKTISKEIEHLAASRQIYEETVKIILSNESLPKENYFLDFLEEWYVHSIVMGLRRQLKTGDGNVSLAGLLKDVAGASHLLSRERFVSLGSSDGRGKKQPNATFNKHAGEGAQSLNPQQICEDLRKFKDIAKKCEEYADRVVAHAGVLSPSVKKTSLRHVHVNSASKALASFKSTVSKPSVNQL